MDIDRYNFKPIYFQIAQSLKQSIASGELAGQLPTEDELLIKYQVSRNTIRTALKKLEAEGLIYRVKGKGTFTSPTQEKQKVMLLLMGLPLEGHRNLHSLLAGVSMRGQEENIQVRIINVNQLPDSVDEIRHNATLQAGALFLRHDGVAQEHIDVLDKCGIPYLFEGSCHYPGVSYVDIDNEDAMKKIVDHLYDYGHRRYALFSLHSDGSTHFIIREDAVKKHLNNHGIVLEDKNFYKIKAYDNDFEADVDSAMSELFSAPVPPSAIICTSDMQAAWICNWLVKHNFRIPEDVSVTGFDDMEFCKYLTPQLTTIRQDYFQLGVIATDYILKIMDNYINRRLQVKVKLELITRGSTAWVKV